jgi:hypothetical protein
MRSACPKRQAREAPTVASRVGLGHVGAVERAGAARYAGAGRRVPPGRA